MIDTMEQLSINEILDNLHPYYELNVKNTILYVKVTITDRVRLSALIIENVNKTEAEPIQQTKRLFQVNKPGTLQGNKIIFYKCS